MSDNNEILVLPGDGIGAEVVPVAVEVMTQVAKRFGVAVSFSEALIGGVEDGSVAEADRGLAGAAIDGRNRSCIRAQSLF